ncbi:hypothetical protein ACFQZI_10405 [Mucilaginibacter lutimaris]|uniref:Uncharacterized protein n=1 Tax=Mucilaginibacter lutimaris TaxID=931629 RepID=A0ABW2ZGB7_9SPHI
MKLFEGEQILMTTDGNAVILTNYRIRLTESKAWGHSQTTSMMLENISSTEVAYLSYPVLFVFAGVCALVAAAMMANGGDLVFLFAIVAVVMIIAYFASRRHVCAIASDGGAKIVFSISGLSKEAVLNFIESVEAAKHKRLSR